MLHKINECFFFKSAHLSPIFTNQCFLFALRKERQKCQKKGYVSKRLRKHNTSCDLFLRIGLDLEFSIEL